MTFLVYSTQIAKSYCWVKYTPKFEKWWSNMHRCMWLAYPEGFNSIEYSVILHWTIMSHSDFSENLSPIGFLGDLDWWFCICTAYRHLLIFRIDNALQCHHSQNQNLNFWLILTLGKSKHSFTEKVTVWLCHCVTWILLLQNIKLFRFTATTTLKCILYVDMWIFFVQEMFFWDVFPKTSLCDMHNPGVQVWTVWEVAPTVFCDHWYIY